MYITKNNYAFVKAIENWEITHYPEYLKIEHDLIYCPKKFKEINRTLETQITNYTKKDNGLYYKTRSTLTSSGTLLGEDNNTLNFSETFSST